MPRTRLAPRVLLCGCSLIGTASWAEGPAADAAPQEFVPEFRCVGAPYGLNLPGSLSLVRRLGRIDREEVQQVEHWDGYTATRKQVFFDGLTLGLVTFSNDPERYLLSSAEISTPDWRLSPFRVGGSVAAARKALGPAAHQDANLESTYAGETDSLRFESASGTLTRVVYECYTG